MVMINAFNPDNSAGLSMEEQALISRRQMALGPAYRLFYQRPVHFVRGHGVYLYDAAGNAYLDAYNNVASVGHCHRYVADAIARQLTVLNTHTRYLHEDVLAYAERLLATMPDALGHMMFTCTGSEANDLALRVARAHTGHDGVIVSQLAYHGVTESTAELSPSLGAGVPVGKRIRTVAAPDRYRLGDEVGAAFQRGVEAAIADMAKVGMKPAALLVDTIFSSDGVFADPPGFMQGAVAAVRAAGGVFIADEVQAGFGRTGDGMWGFARHGLVPDIVTMGKPMGNGHPMGGMACKPEVIAEFAAKARYFNTFGGNPVSMAAGQAVLDVIADEDLIGNAKRVGVILLAGLRELATRHEAIGDVRGAGFFIGVELVKDRSAKVADAELTARVVNQLRERRILISASGPLADILKIRPPLPFSASNADQLLSTLEDILGEHR
jgi:4-aminobutyrate aminotransferase-like enzyme